MNEEEQMERWIQIGQWLTQVRGRRSARSVALASGNSPAWLANLERGFELKGEVKIPINPSPDRLGRLADVLGIGRDEMGSHTHLSIPPTADDDPSLVEMLTVARDALDRTIDFLQSGQ